MELQAFYQIVVESRLSCFVCWGLDYVVIHTLDLLCPSCPWVRTHCQPLKLVQALFRTALWTSMRLCLCQVCLLTHLSCSQTFAGLTMFERPDLFPHQDLNSGDKEYLQAKYGTKNGPVCKRPRYWWAQRTVGNPFSKARQRLPKEETLDLTFEGWEVLSFLVLLLSGCSSPEWWGTESPESREVTERVLYRTILRANLPPSSWLCLCVFANDHHSWPYWLVTFLHRKMVGGLSGPSSEYPATPPNQVYAILP